MFARSLGPGTVRAFQIGQLFLQRRLELVELAQFLVQGINLAGKLALLFFQAGDALVVLFLELVEFLAQGFGDFFDVFFFNSHERLLQCDQ
ncbi:hypothetical protein D3C80_1297690 [compost metagenome]